MTDSQSDQVRHCPKCRQALRRVRRSGADRAAAPTSARYVCTAAGCGWAGLRRARESPRTAASPAIALSAWLAGLRLRAERVRAAVDRSPVLLMTVGTAAVLVVLAGRQLAAEPPVQMTQAAPAPIRLAPGGHHEGDTPAADDPLLIQPDLRTPQTAAVELLDVRQGCVWGQPGRNPYRGTVEEALVTARLPPEVVKLIAYKVRQGQIDDRLEISNAGIRGVRQGGQYDPGNVAMTYGRTLCVNTQVNLPQGGVEPASLYEAEDRQGRVHAVMVPDVCGNVSVLSQRGERVRPTVAGMIGERERPGLAVADDAAPAVAGAGDVDQAMALDAAGRQAALGAFDGRPGAPGGVGGRQVASAAPVLPVLDDRRQRAFTAERFPQGNDIPGVRTQINQVPEPSTLACVMAALAALVLGRRRRPARAA